MLKFIILFAFITNMFAFDIINQVDSKIKFPIGELNISNTIHIKNSHNIIIEGNYTKIIMGTPLQGVFKIENSSNITIKNISIDYKILPHVAGKIISISKKNNTLTIKPFNNYVQSLDKNLILKSKKRKMYLYPLETPGVVKSKGTTVSYIRNIVKIKHNLYKIDLKKIKSHISINDIIVIVFRVQNGSTFFIRDSQNIFLDNNIVYASPAAAITTLNTDNLNINNCKVILKKSRWISSNADGVHSQSSRMGPTIRQSTFQGLGDDCIAIYTKPIPLLSSKGNQLQVKPPYYLKNMIRKGDVVYFFNKKIKKNVLKTIVTKKVSQKNNIIYLQKIPRSLENLELYDTNLSGDNYNIQENTFIDSRRYGILLKVHSGLIYKNIFKNLGGNAIKMSSYSSNYLIGEKDEQTMILNNIISNCGFGINKYKSAININIADDIKEKSNTILLDNIIID